MASWPLSGLCSGGAFCVASVASSCEASLRQAESPSRHPPPGRIMQQVLLVHLAQLHCIAGASPPLGMSPGRLVALLVCAARSGDKGRARRKKDPTHACLCPGSLASPYRASPSLGTAGAGCLCSALRGVQAGQGIPGASHPTNAAPQLTPKAIGNPRLLAPSRTRRIVPLLTPLLVCKTRKGGARPVATTNGGSSSALVSVSCAHGCFHLATNCLWGQALSLGKGSRRIFCFIYLNVFSVHFKKVCKRAPSSPHPSITIFNRFLKRGKRH